MDVKIYIIKYGRIKEVLKVPVKRKRSIKCLIRIWFGRDPGKY